MESMARAVCRRTLRLVILLTLALPGCTGLEKPLMEIGLETTSGLGIRATLHNLSPRARRVLHSSDLQPSRVMLTDSAGKVLTPFDNRTRSKFDRTVRAAMFQRITERGSLELDAAAFRKNSAGSYDLHWGPYEYREIPAGIWKVQVIFECLIDRPTDKSPVPDAWSGTAASKVVEIRLK